MKFQETQSHSADPPESFDPREALIDALIVEHARAGRGNDEAMLATIRSRTVDQPAPTRVVELVPHESQPLPRRQVDPREWLKIAAIVTVSLSILGMVLFQSPAGITSPDRTEQTFQLVSLPLESVAVSVDEGHLAAKARLPEVARVSSTPGEISVPGLTPLASGGGALSGSVPLADSRDPVSDVLLAEFSISAEKLYELPSDRLVYEGRVILRHPEFTLEADRLELAAPEDGERVGTFVAKGDDLRIEKHLPAGGTEIARGTSATWDANGGSIILAGAPPTLSAGNSFVRPQSSDGFIILRADGYQVIER